MVFENRCKVTLVAFTNRIALRYFTGCESIRITDLFVYFLIIMWMNYESIILLDVYIGLVHKLNFALY